MYNLKLGLLMYVKNIIINILIIVQLFVVIAAVNSVILFSNGSKGEINIAENLMDKQLIHFPNYLTKVDIDKILSELNGEPYLIKQKTINGEDTLSKKIFELRATDFGFLLNLKYDLYKGRWFTADDKGKKFTVVSKNSGYNVGDYIDIRAREFSEKFRVIGIFNENEKIPAFSSSSSSSTLAAILPAPDADKIVCVTDNVEEMYEKINELGIYIIGFKERLDDDVYQDNLSKLKLHTLHAQSIDEMHANSQEEFRFVNRLMMPIILFIAVISFFGFILISIINIKNCEKEFSIILALGAVKSDLLKIMAFVVSIPIIINAIAFLCFTRVQILPLIVGATIVTWINYFVAFMILLAYFTLNYSMLCYKFFRNGGVKS